MRIALTMASAALDRVGYFIRASTVMARDVGAASARIRGRRDHRRDDAAFKRLGRSVDDVYPIDPEWNAHLHAALGAGWPCDCEADAVALHARIRGEFKALGLPDAPGNWCDGGEGFTLAVATLCRHLGAETVVETGIARGVTSRFVLESMESRNAGRLASIDLPNIDSRYHEQHGIAVPPDLRARWSIEMGPSRRLLPGLLDRLGTIDLFIHDSLHSGPNVRFEAESAWRVLRPGGALLIDDVYGHLAFHDLVEELQPSFSVIGANLDGGYRFGIMLKSADLADDLTARVRG